MGTGRLDTPFTNSGTGTVHGVGSEPPSYLSQDVNFQQFWDIWQLLQKEYVDRPVSDTKLFYGALAGLVAGVGDPYTVFFDPATAKEFDDELAGTFEGIGAEIGLKDNRITVIAPLEGTPAERAGIQTGDVIRSIDGQDTTGMSVENAVNRIRGKRGTTVTLVLYRPSTDQETTQTVTRDTINVQSVKFEMRGVGEEKNIAYIRIAHFSEDTSEAFAQAVTAALGKNPKGIILDLRNNPGGFLDTAVEVASAWIDEGTIVTEQGDRRVDHPAEGTSPLKGQKTIVLVNGGSASASEIVAGALQDAGAATLLGEKTFGKGSVQALRQLADGSAVKITVAKWLTPKGRSINDTGITPDVVLPIDAATLKPDEDPQLNRAFEMLLQ